MAHSLTLSPSLPGTLTVPDDGDDLVAASVETPFQQSGNWLLWIYNRINGTSQFPGSISLAGGITCNDISCLDVNSLGNVIAQGEVYGQAQVYTDGDMWAGGDIEADQNVIVGANLGVGGSATFASFVTVTGVFSTLTHIQSGGNVDAVGSITAGSGSDVPKRTANGPDLTTTISTKDADVWFANLSSSKTWTLGTTGAKNGQMVWICNDTPASFNLSIEAGAEDCVIPPGGMAVYVFMSGAYRLMKLWT